MKKLKKLDGLQKLVFTFPSIIVIRYSCFTASEISDFRKKARQKNVYIKVAKNSSCKIVFSRFLINNNSWSYFRKSSMILFSNDIICSYKILSFLPTKFVKTSFVVENRVVYSPQDLKNLNSIKSIRCLYLQAVYLLYAPIKSLVCMLCSLIRKMLYILYNQKKNIIKNKKE